MNRVCLVTNAEGDILAVASDHPVRFFLINDFVPHDRVFEFTPGNVLKIGVEHVQDILQDDPIGHKHDQTKLGSGYGPRKPPSRPTIKLVE